MLLHSDNFMSPNVLKNKYVAPSGAMFANSASGHVEDFVGWLLRRTSGRHRLAQVYYSVTNFIMNGIAIKIMLLIEFYLSLINCSYSDNGVVVSARMSDQCMLSLWRSRLSSLLHRSK